MARKEVKTGTGARFLVGLEPSVAPMPISDSRLRETFPDGSPKYEVVGGRVQKIKYAKTGSNSRVRAR